ncbi:hypothetical protein I3843_05G045500 [Carya illinoinensis]|uniref:Uncharacterized protein n=1 Tax=Carya illinoinensis TaxID=32201 RepID=A0A8T1QFT6_CARIL|nr:uncharacterized protein LOC122310009 [Carya illinoinensis]KAG2705363.1 hypothetical protein I3760_05G049900 [Carya illinoinensis]KAG6653064.1 hypothetical protein CIPAW_05G049400 [Carya illinoinensis]KAG6711359.1 hypothetical protein I3842_05G049300 [Carya illinoinensis]KAG7977719.1 hypothetical protein I3843_05G045500 [Carya illinoinensis]
MGDHLKNPHLEEEEEAEEAEEALSLCDLPLKPNNEDDEDNKAGLEDQYSSKYTPRSRSETPDFFEFFSDFSSEMCPADDIFFCGKLIAIKEQYFPTPASHQIPKASTNTEESHTNKTTFRRRSDSLSKLQRPVTRSNSGSNPELRRNSRSLDYKKLHRSSNSMISTAPEIEKSSSAKSVQGKSDMVLKKAGKPRRYLFMFGMVKFPPEMELSDIKNRQVRNNPPSTLFPPPIDVHGKIPVNQSSSKGSWRLLRALSCKDHASVAVTASFCIRHA